MSDNTLANREAFSLLCGEQIGYGMSRTVYQCAILPGCVVKVETDSRRFQNVMEWEIWQRVKDTPASRWFAACKWISPSGLVLVMERTRVPGPREYLDKVPAWFTDMKRQNWGMAKSGDKRGKEWLVCHDYGTSLVIEEGTITKRLKKADWWDE